MNTPAALEQQIHRIHELLESSQAKVTWNDHIPDPDNPTQLRQIDISIREDNRLTIVECRLSRSRQNVKWIEELIGRRQSLGADKIIGVSSSGFTGGARKKAERYAVQLRDLQRLSDSEILNWGGRLALTLFYYLYSDVRLTIGLAWRSLPKLDPTALEREIEGSDLVQSVFNQAARQLDTLRMLALNDTRTISFGVLVRPESLRLCGEQVLEAGMEGKARLVAQPITSPTVLRYGEPAQQAFESGVTIERFGLGETSVVHNHDRIALEIDLSDVVLPPLSQIRYVRSTSADELEYESLAICDPKKLRVTGPLNVAFYPVEYA